MSSGDTTPQRRLVRDMEQPTYCLDPGRCRSKWYLVLHDLLPTKERLHKIALADTPSCTTCGQVDTLSHRPTDCGEGKKIWRWTKGHLATILCTQLMCGPSVQASDLRPSRSTVPFYGYWPTLSTIGPKTTPNQHYTTILTSGEEPDGRHSP
jgi:hypothetical protein